MSDLPPLSSELAWPAGLSPFAPNDRAIQRNPYAHYTFLREHAPIVRTRTENAEVWFASRYDDVAKGLRDHETFSSQVIDPKKLPFLLVADPPEHTRLRQAVSRAFTPRAVSQLDGFVKERVHYHWGRFVAAGGGEAFGAMTQPITLETIGHMIGIPAEEAYQLLQWAHDSQNYFGRVARGTPGSPNDEAAMEHMLGYFRKCLAKALASEEETIAGNIARLQQEGAMTDHETTHLCLMLLLAGMETTAISLLNGMILMAERPALAARLSENPADVGKFVLELIRYKGPAHRLVRIATRDSMLGDVMVPAGTEIRFLVASANRDSLRFENGDSFEMDRKPGGPLYFGLGIHACLGMHLARQELAMGFEEIARSGKKLLLDTRHPIDYLEGGSMGVTGPVSAHILLQ